MHLDIHARDPFARLDAFRILTPLPAGRCISRAIVKLLLVRHGDVRVH